jgi:hypothetical protein
MKKNKGLWPAVLTSKIYSAYIWISHEAVWFL